MIRYKRKRNRPKREMENKIKRNRKAEMGEGEEAMLYYDIIYSLLYIRFLISASSHDQISSLLS